MPRETVKVLYEELFQSFLKMTDMAEQANDVYRDLLDHRDALDGEWVGFGGRSFFSEMDDHVLPAVEKLRFALRDSAMLMADISRKFTESEESEALHIQAIALDSLLERGAVSSAGPSEAPPPADPIPANGNGMIQLNDEIALPNPAAQPFESNGMTPILLEYGDDGILGIDPNGVDLIPNSAATDADTVGVPVHSMYDGTLFVDPIDPNRAHLIPDANPDVMITYTHVDTSSLPLDSESNTLAVAAGDQVGTIVDINEDLSGYFPEGTPNHLNISATSRTADPQTGKQESLDVSRLLNLE